MRKSLLVWSSGVVVGVLLVALCSLSAGAEASRIQAPPDRPLAALGTAFNYQGRLTDGGAPADGLYDLRFTLYDAEPSGTGTVVAGPIIEDDLSVLDGLFGVELDFGDVFAGVALYLEIAVRPYTSSLPGDWVVLSPRQPLNLAPYAGYSRSTGSLRGDPVADVAPALDQVLTWDGGAWAPEDSGLGSFSAYSDLSTEGYLNNDAGGDLLLRDQADGRYWTLSGNAGTVAGPDYLGTADDQPLELHVYGVRALRIEPTGWSPNIIGGYAENSVTAGVQGATISGGGDHSEVLANHITDHYGAIGGGYDNQAGDGAGTVDDAEYATVGGGRGNTASGEYGTVAGGYTGSAGPSAFVGGGSNNNAAAALATIAGGAHNTVTDTYSTIGGGHYNQVLASYGTIAGGGGSSPSVGNLVTDDYGFVGGGFDNQAGTENGLTDDAPGATIGGGSYNRAAAAFATIGGGGSASSVMGNLVTDNYGTVGGGENNQAGDDAGSLVDADHATVGGGQSNEATGSGATVGGGRSNLA